MSLATIAASQGYAIVFDCAADPAYNDGWQSGDNGGLGFGAWSLNSSSNSGHFIATSNNNGGGGGVGIDTIGVSWGMYANSGDISSASRSILNPLAVGETFFMNFDNGWINDGSLVQTGLSMAGFGSVIRFTGGTSNYELVDTTGTATSTISFTDGGLLAEWVITSSTSYDFRLTRLNDNAVWTTSRSIGGTAFDRFIFTNSNAGSNSPHDAFINSTGVVPEPSSLLVLGLAGVAFFVKRKR
ncbi:MAG TPA: PEP-CTERM sorting domain-containing protein [Fimbriimonadaceae bacterium]|nr:PEP-CTERM sorting domain-containing protein [Fimbriimonadaceae bacterium]